jgi:hypothetical protein
MNCRAFHDLLQQYLDGEGAGPGGRSEGSAPEGLSPHPNPSPQRGEGLAQERLNDHLRDCPGCRALFLAARRLREGLRLLTPPAPPADLAGRIVGQVGGRRGRRAGRLLALAAAGALAAGLLAALAPHPGTRPQPGPAPRPAEVPASAPVARGKPAPRPATPVRLRDSVAEAGSAVAALTSRTADETVGPTRALLPAVSPGVERLALDNSVEAPTGPLREAGEGVSEGLEPVARSARRAVGLLLRELPPGLEDSVPNLSPGPVPAPGTDEGTSHP